MTTTEEKARKAAEQAERAEAAAKAAKDAEEAAARAKAAARNALKAAEAAAAEAGLIDDPEEPAAPVAADTDVEDDTDTKVETAPKAKVKTKGKGGTEAETKVDVEKKPAETVVEEDSAEEASEDEPDDEPVKAKKTVGLRKRGKKAAADTEADAEGEAVEDDEGEDDTPRARGRRFTLLSGVLTVLIVALVAGGVALFLQVNEVKATEKASQQAVLAANRAAQDLSSYDYRTLDGDFKTAVGHTTGKLRRDYDKLAQQLKVQATEQQAVATTTVIKVGAIDATPTKVTVLVYANRNTATKSDKEKRLPEALRMKITMVKSGDRWLASDLMVLS